MRNREARSHRVSAPADRCVPEGRRSLCCRLSEIPAPPPGAGCFPIFTGGCALPGLHTGYFPLALRASLNRRVAVCILPRIHPAAKAVSRSRSVQREWLRKVCDGDNRELPDRHAAQFTLETLGRRLVQEAIYEYNN